MNDFTDAPSIKPDHATLNVTWTVLIQIRLNCVFFEGCIPPPLRFMACIQIQSSYSGRFIFLHLSTLPRPDFPGSHGAKKHYRLVLFWARALQSFYFLCFLSWRMQTCNDSYVLEARNVWRLNSQNMARRHFFSLPFFCIEHSLLFTLFSFSYLNFVSVICLFWHTLTARDDTRDRDANSSRQNDVTWRDFLQGKQVELSLSRSLLPHKTKNLPLALSARENNWAGLVPKSTQRPTKGELWESGHLWEGVPWVTEVFSRVWWGASSATRVVKPREKTFRKNFSRGSLFNT